MSIFYKYTSFPIFSKKSFLKRGFTLLELIVVMTIATIIITTLVIQQNSWNNRLAVNIQAYEMALMIRQAQIYSLGVREYVPNTGDRFDLGYGVYVDGSSNTTYTFYADKNKNQKYDAANGEEIETKTLGRGVTIEKFCGTFGGGERCSGGGFGIDSLNVSFYRPEPKANITFLNSGGNPPGSVNAPAIIYFLSSGGDETWVKVESNGQVSIKQ